MPHSLLHIVDNSANRDAVQAIVADDPSLYSTIVVTATPMGEDKRIVTLTRSDVAAVSYGLGSLTNADIEKYGQGVEYPMALIEQGAPVRLLRVTPEGSTYAYAIILVQWLVKKNPATGLDGTACAAGRVRGPLQWAAWRDRSGSGFPCRRTDRVGTGP